MSDLSGLSGRESQNDNRRGSKRQIPKEEVGDVETPPSDNAMSRQGLESRPEIPGAAPLKRGDRNSQDKVKHRFEAIPEAEVTRAKILTKG